MVHNRLIDRDKHTNSNKEKIVAVPMREPIGRNSPIRIYEFGEKIHEKLIRDDEAKKAARERSGKMSGGKLGKPTLWAVLDLIGSVS